MSVMDVKVTISADASAVGAAVQKGSSELSAFTSAAREMTAVLQAGFAQITSLSERMNASLQAGFAQTGFVLRSMASGMGAVRDAAETELPKVVPEIEKIEKATEKAKFGLGELGQKLGALGMALSLSVTAPMAAATYGIFETTKRMDSLKLSLTAVAGSADGMKKQLTDLMEVAKLPGLGLQEVVDGSIRLQAAGFSAEQAKKSLMAFGNALATVGKGKAELDGVTTALSQIQSKGKVFAEEINQLNERLPQIRTAMKAAFGTANSEDLQKLGLSSEEFVAKVSDEFAKLPSVAGGLANDMENLQDRWLSALSEMGEGLKPFFSTALQVFTAVADKIAALGRWYGSLSDSQKSWVVSIAGVVAAIGPAVFSVSKMITIAVEAKALWAAWTTIMEGWKAAQIAATVATEAGTVATGLARLGFAELTATMLANPFVAAAAAIVAVTLAVIGLKNAMDDLSKTDLEEKAARSPEAMAAKKKVESYQYAYDHLSAGKEKDEVGRKLGRAKSELDAQIAKDDEFIRKGTTLEPGNAQGAATFDVKGVLEKRGIYERNAQPDKGAAKSARQAASIGATLDRMEAQVKAQEAENAQLDRLEKEGIDQGVANAMVARDKELAQSEEKFRELRVKAKGHGDLIKRINEDEQREKLAIYAKGEEKIQQAIKAADAKEAQAEAKKLERREAAEQKVLKSYADVLKKQAALLKKNLEENQRLYDMTAGKVVHTMTSAMTTISTTNGSLRHKLQMGWQAFYEGLGHMMVQELANWIEIGIKKAVFNNAQRAADAAATKAAQAEAIASAALTGAALSQAYATAAAYASVASFGAASLQGGAALAAAVAEAKALGSFAVGTPSVPQDMVAQIHKGETIVPSTFAESIRRGELTLGGPGAAKGGSNHSASLVLGSDIMAAIADQGHALVKIMKNQERMSFA